MQTTHSQRSITKQNAATRSNVLSGVFSIEPLESRQYATASVGVEFIGLSSTTPNFATNITPNNPAVLASLIAQSGVKNPVVGFLPFEFNPSNPFASATALVQKTLPAVSGTLEMDVYLDWFPHDAPGSAAQGAFWKSCDKTSTVPSSFIERVHEADLWASSMASWARANGIAPSKLQLSYIPVLEDTCTDKTAYSNLLAKVQQKEAADGVAPAALRRSTLIQNAVHVAGASLEVHGTWAQASPHLNSGDTWTPDGASESYISGQFLTDEKKALAAGVNVQVWDASFNGAPYARTNEASRLVNPFSSEIKSLVVASLERQ